MAQRGFRTPAKNIAKSEQAKEEPSQQYHPDTGPYLLQIDGQTKRSFKTFEAAHSAALGGVGLAAACHFVASLPDYPHSQNIVQPPLIEYDVGDNALRDTILKEPIIVENGACVLPNRPGLGIELDPAAIRRFNEPQNPLDVVASVWTVLTVMLEYCFIRSVSPVRLLVNKSVGDGVTDVSRRVLRAKHSAG
jgi:hypothetical protein